MISKVSDTLYRGPLPESPDELSKLGIRNIVSLESGERDHFYPNREYLWPFQFGQIACSSIFPPSDQAVERFLFVVKYCKPSTYVHCLRGKDRTGYMCAVYRMQVQKWSYRDAVDEMYALGFNRLLYWWWTFKLKTKE